MKSVEPNTRTSKRSRAEATATTLTSGAIPAAEKVHVDPTAIVESFMTVKPTITPSSLNLCYDGVLYDYSNSSWTTYL